MGNQRKFAGSFCEEHDGPMEDDGILYTEAQKLVNSMIEALKDVKIYDCQCQLLTKRCRAVQNWLDLLGRTVPIYIIESSSEMRELIDVLKKYVSCNPMPIRKNRFQNKRAEFMDAYDSLTSCMYRATKEIKKAVATVLMAAIEQDISDSEASEAAGKDQSNINLLVLDAGEDLILGELLGEGTFANVYKSKLYGREVAVKEFKLPEDSQHEILVVQRFVDHPNVLQILGQCKKGEKAYLVMELMKTDLAKLLKEKGPLTLLTAIDIMSQIAKAMFRIHEHDIVHRDLKPANILVNYIEDGTALTDVQIKVADFGISRTDFRTNAPNALELTRYRGTLGYMGPEMFNKQLPYSRKLDVYSFGIVCREMFGWSPDCEFPSSCPEDLQKLIKECFSDAPDERPAFSTICSHLFKRKQDASNTVSAEISDDAGDIAETSNTVSVEISDDAGNIAKTSNTLSAEISDDAGHIAETSNTVSAEISDDARDIAKTSNTISAEISDDAGHIAETSNKVTFNAGIYKDAGGVSFEERKKLLQIQSVLKGKEKLQIQSVLKGKEKLQIQSVLKENKKLQMLPRISSNVMHFFQRKHGILGTSCPPNPSMECQTSATEERPPSPNPSIEGQVSATQERACIRYSTQILSVMIHLL